MNELWKKQQNQAIDEWHYYQNNGENFYNLIEQSVPIIIDNIKIKTGEKLLSDTDVYIDIRTNKTYTSTWVSSAENDINTIWYFIEALTFPNKNYYFFCSNEGPVTFFFVKTEDCNKIRFILITDGIEDTDKTDYFKIKQDFIIDKKIFVKEIYESFYATINNSNIEDMMPYEIGTFEQLYKDSNIIKKYLGINK